jgi:hypothetical protein
MEHNFTAQELEAILDRAKEIDEALSVTVYGPCGPETEDCASSWGAAKLIAGLELRVAELEKRVKALNTESKRLRIGLSDPS